MTSVLSPLRLRLRFAPPVGGESKGEGKPAEGKAEIQKAKPRAKAASNGTAVAGTLILPATELGGAELTLTLRSHPRARHLSLRLDSKRGEFVLVRPRRVSQRAAREFALRNRAWMESKLAALAPRLRLQEGAEFPLHGAQVRLAIDANLPRGKTPQLRDGTLYFAAPMATLERRCMQWLRLQARAQLEDRAAYFLSLLTEHEKNRKRTSLTFARLLRDNKKLSVRLTDPTTRWGSCSRSGRMAFSWRLVLVPAFVADYVVAHEVVHLRHFHHGESFWRTLAAMGVETNAAKEWLARNGDDLLRYGPPPATRGEAKVQTP